MKAKKTAEESKDELLAALHEVRCELLAAASAVSPDRHDIPFLGVWSANDLVAHLAGWDYANLAAIEAVIAGRLPDFYHRYDPGWRSFNADLVAEHKRRALAETIAAAQASHAALLAKLEAMSAEDILRDHGVRSPKGRRVTVQMLLAAEASDERLHLEQLTQFLRV